MNKSPIISQLLQLSYFLLFGVVLLFLHYLLVIILPSVWPAIFIIAMPTALTIITFFYMIYLQLKKKLFSRFKILGSVLVSLVLVYPLPDLLLKNQHAKTMLASFQSSCESTARIATPTIIDFLPCLLRSSIYWMVLSLVICCLPISLAELIITWRKKDHTTEE